MATYYIDPTAAFNGDGTTYTQATSTNGVGAKNTWSIGAGPWVAGNVLLQRAGTTWDGELLIYATGTSEAARITIGSYDPLTGLQTTKKAIRTSTGTTRPIVGSGKTYITVQDTAFVGGQVGANRRAFTAFGADYMVLRRCEFRDVSSDGSTDCNGVFITGNYVTVEDCIVHDIADDGIWIDGLNPRIVRNTVYRVAQSGRVAGDCIQVYGGDVRQSNGDFYIAHNTVDHSELAVKHGIIVSGSTLGSGGVIEYNAIQGPNAATEGFAGILCDQPSATVRGNRVAAGFTGISVQAGIYVLGNVFDGCTTGIELSTTASAGSTIANNTVANSLAYAVYCAVVSTGSVVKNNVYFNCAKGSMVTSSVARSSNAMFGVAANRSDCSGGGCAVETYATSDPLLSSDYRKKPGSPLLGAGEHLGYGYKFRDIDGKQRPNPPSIGADDAATLRRVLGS